MDESLAWFPVGSSTRGTAAVASAHLYFWQVMFGVRVSCHVPWALSPSWHALFSVLVYLGPVKNTSTTPTTNGVRIGVRTFQVLFDPFLAKILCNRYLDQMLAVRFHPEHHTGSIHGSFSALVGDRIMLFLFSFLLMADAKWWALVCFQRWNKHWTVASAGDAGSLVSPDLLSSNFDRTQGDVHEGWNLVITKLSYHQPHSSRNSSWSPTSWSGLSVDDMPPLSWAREKGGSLTSAPPPVLPLIQIIWHEMLAWHSIVGLTSYQVPWTASRLWARTHGIQFGLTESSQILEVMSLFKWHAYGWVLKVVSTLVQKRWRRVQEKVSGWKPGSAKWNGPGRRHGRLPLLSKHWGFHCFSHFSYFSFVGRYSHFLDCLPDPHSAYEMLSYSFPELSKHRWGWGWG